MFVPLTATLLAALCLGLGRCGGAGSPWPGCDCGKTSLERDLPQGAMWACPVSSWLESTQRLPSIDTVYDPEPARQVCLDKPISYNLTIPNSGAYRPLRAESGEYLYCPPQRWLNNLHHGATVLLYHPCAPLREQVRLSVLARSCLSNYIITPYPQLSKRSLVALVSWGRTLELSTVATSDVCDWLERTTTGSMPGDVSQTRKYNLLLTRPAEHRWSGEQEHQHTHPEKHSTKTKQSVRRCCEQTLFPLLDGGMEGKLQRDTREVKEERSQKQSREKEENIEDEKERETSTAHASSLSINENNGTILSSTEPHEVQKKSGASAKSPLGTSTSSGSTLKPDPPGDSPSPGSQNLTPRPVTSVGFNEDTLTTESLSSRTSEPVSNPELQKRGLAQRPGPPRPNPEDPDPKYPDPTPGREALASGKGTLTPGPETPLSDLGKVTVSLSKETSAETKTTNAVKQRDKDSAKQNTTEEKLGGKTDGAQQTEKDSAKDSVTEGKTKDNVVDIKEREVENKPTHSNAHTHSKSKKTGSGSQPQPHPAAKPHHSHPQPATYLSDTPGCGGCEPGGRCDCTEASGTQGGAALPHKGMPHTPRTDEAVWAAAALGFLLVLLALSVLHTRLYRHWRTTPSLYWRDPRQDYDSVADVIRRRLRIAERRRKRRSSQGRRMECVLLPTSSSSDEDQ
ncbi:uncharacterized protein tp53i13 [Polymixia lowei]